MTFHLDERWVIGVLLLSCRLAAALALTPLLGQSVPVQVRVLMVIGLSLCLVSSVASYLGPTDTTAVLTGMLSELLVGGVLAVGILAAFAAFAVAGKVLDLQSGLSLATMFDPSTQAPSPILATALRLLAVVLFYALDGHHALLRGLALSIEQVPLGTGFVVELQPFVRQFGMMFTLGLALIAPAFGCLLLVELATAITSRMLPQANVLMLSIPVKIFVGLGMLAVALPYLAPTMRAVYGSILLYWQGVLSRG